MANEIIDFRGERERHTQVLGRESVFRKLDRYLSQDGCNWVLVKGTPGMGKSAILAHYLKGLRRDGQTMPHHFLQRDFEDLGRPEVVAQNLAAQVEKLFSLQAHRDARPAFRLREVLQRVSEEVLVPRGERLILVVDGLDEAKPGPLGENPLPQFLPPALPKGVQVLCSSRPTYPYLSWLERQDGIHFIDLDDANWSDSNGEAVRAYWTTVARRFEPPLTPGFIDEAVRSARGNLLHAQMLSRWLEDLPEAQRRVELLPQGLDGVLTGLWERIQELPGEDRAVAFEGLSLLTVAREALSLPTLAAVAGWPSQEKGERFLRATRPFLLKVPVDGVDKTGWRPFHESFSAFIKEKLGEDGLLREHHRLAQSLCPWPVEESGGKFRRRYALRHAVTHWLEAGEGSRARSLCEDMGYLEAKCREVGVIAVEADLGAVSEKDTGPGRELLRDLHRAVRAESHWLNRHQEALALLVYNRLLCSGRTREGIEKALRFPLGAPGLRLRHPVKISGDEIRTLKSHDNKVKGCAVTADGRRVVSASSDRTLKVWELETGQVVATLKGHEDSVKGCAVTADGRVVSVSNDGTLRVWELETGRLLRTLGGHSGVVNGCAVTADGRRAMSASDDKTLRVWDLETGQCLATLTGHEGLVKACAVTADGRRAVSASADRTLKVWCLETGQCLATLQGHESWVQGCLVTADGRVVSASDDKTLRVWDLETGHWLATLTGHEDRVHGCAVTADGQRLVSVSADTTLKVWCLKTGQCLATLRGHEGWVNGCTVTGDGRVVSACDDKTLKVWDLEVGHALASLDSRGDWVKGCAVTADGRLAVSTSKDKTLKVWDLETGQVVATLEGHGDAVRGCAVAPGERVVSASKDRTLKVWSLETHQDLTTFEGHSGVVNGCAVIGQGRVVSASSDKTLKVWSLRTGECLSTLEGHEDGVMGCAVTGDGKVVSASADRTLKVWRPETGEVLDTLRGHDGMVKGCVVTGDGKVVSASADKTLKVWGLRKGAVPATLRGHDDVVKGCAVTGDGKVVSASKDRTLKVWDLQSGRCLQTLYGNSSFECVAAARDMICAGDSLGNVWILDASSAPATSVPRTRRKPAALKADRNQSQDLGVVIALKEEFRVFRDVLKSLSGHLRPKRSQHTGQIDYAFEFPGSSHRCVVTFIDDMNPGPAALCTERLITRWKPRTVVMLGIAAGIHPDVRIGDVVIARQVDNYQDSAKAVPAATPAAFELMPGGSVYRGDHDFVTSASHLEFAQENAFRDWRRTCQEALLQHIPGEARSELVRQGLIRPEPELLSVHLASGPVVGAAREFSQWLRQKRDRNLMAMDMESAGLMASAIKRIEPKRTLVIRGISDYGDERKSMLDSVEGGALRRYAMHNATQFLRLLLETGVIPHGGR
jgi:WD40 repeat protein/nucleoside phosphorylase